MVNLTHGGKSLWKRKKKKVSVTNKWKLQYSLCKKTRAINNYSASYC